MMKKEIKFFEYIAVLSKCVYQRLLEKLDQGRLYD